nr:hypothetical protein [Tanacetum cinerariifolium]
PKNTRCYNEDEDEEDEEEEEYLAPADTTIVIPTDELVSSSEGTEPDAISFPPEAEIERLLAMPTTLPSPLTSLSPPSTGERLTICMAPAALPPPLHMPPPIDCRDDILEIKMLPRKRLCLSTLGSRDTWIDPAETVPEIAPMTVGEWVDLLIEDRIAHQETIQIVEDEAYAVRETWAHSIGLSQAVHFELHTHQEQVCHAQMAETLPVMEDMRREMGDMQDELLALRGQPRRVGQPGGDARVLNHQDTYRDADSNIWRLCLDAYSMTWEVLKKKMTNKYYPQGESKKLEIKLWNLKVKENNVSAYTERFQELTLICTKFVADETQKIGKYVSGLPDNIYWSVKASKPKTLDETIELANDLMDQKLCTYVERQSNNKIKADESFSNNHGHQQQAPKRQIVIRVYNMGTGKKKPYSGNLPKSSSNANVANAQRNNGENPKGNGCFESEATGHFKRDCPKLKNKEREKGNAPGWVYAVGNAEKGGNASRDPDLNVVMGTFVKPA